MTQPFVNVPNSVNAIGYPAEVIGSATCTTINHYVVYGVNAYSDTRCPNGAVVKNHTNVMVSQGDPYIYDEASAQDWLTSRPVSMTTTWGKGWCYYDGFFTGLSTANTQPVIIYNFANCSPQSTGGGDGGGGGGGDGGGGGGGDGTGYCITTYTQSCDRVCKDGNDSYPYDCYTWGEWECETTGSQTECYGR